MPTLSSLPPIRANAVIVVVIVVVNVTRRRNAKKNTTHNLNSYLLSLVLHAIDILFTSVASLDQYSAESPLSKFKFIESSM